MLLTLFLACPQVVDDDVILPGEDDDSAGGLDSLDLAVVAWFIEDEHALTSDTVETTSTLLASLRDGGIPTWVDSPGPDHLPLPGNSLHPDQLPVLPEEEGCLVLGPEDLESFPDSLDLGPIEARDGSASVIGASWSNDRYLSSQIATAPADELDMVLLAIHPEPVTLPSAFDLPERPASILPQPGPVGPLSNLTLSWTPAPGSGLEILAVRYPNLVDGTQWVAVRCVAVDDGQFTVDASALAPAGSGPVLLRIARARWQEVSGDGRSGWTVGVRIRSFELVPGR